ncbi:tumor protein p53-inducible protein 13 [Nematolebias whitei]|uniref:tumor protein p53-inducible protein 13 n=1 Tax=Nematolebias whitei TaxID=451745 RepID=UPI00189AF944|nr:tumor protein p53-inducible protein 13 [Nematolebias whitei]
MPPSQVRSLRRAGAVLAAVLWASLARSGSAESPGAECDNGKLYLDRDLPPDAVYWRCSAPIWTESLQGLPNIDTVYDPEPAKKVCMDRPISYSNTIPSSGAFRPVTAASGEYLYCPPQRWLGNVHRGAAVLLYHPCAPVHERHLLSQLAHSCLPDYIITPHPQLSTHRPIALVSWGRTLETTSVVSSDVCEWLQVTQSTKPKSDGVTQTRKYDFLLTRSAGLHLLQRLTEMKGTLRRCCERTISLLTGTTDGVASTKREHLKLNKQRNNSRKRRAAVRDQEETSRKRNETTTSFSLWTSQTSRTNPQRAEFAQNDSSTHGSAAGSLPGKPSVPVSAPQNDSSGLKEAQDGGAEVEALQPRHKAAPPGPHGSSGGVKTEQDQPVSSEVLAARSKDQDTDPVKQDRKDSAQRGKKSQSVDQKARHAAAQAAGRHADPNLKLSNVQSHSASDLHQDSELEPGARRDPGSEDCGGCGADGPCDCTQNRAAAVKVGLQRTPRTDEAVWAAAALGFLLVLLTLSILHTRLYRHWRTAPSLYWHDPQQDYDSVADVIRRRLRITKRRRKRGRRQEYVLLPSSSSSDERP